MRYVLDSSVAFKSVVLEQDSSKAIRLLDEYRRGLHELIAPDIFPHELAHALTRAERQGRLAIGQALAHWTDVMRFPPQFVPCLTLVPRAIEIASSARIGVYDCDYVALAERESCEFLTADTKLARNLQSQFPFIVLLSSMP